MSVPNRKGAAVTETRLQRINILTLIVAHAKDDCSKAPPEGTERIGKFVTFN